MILSDQLIRERAFARIAEIYNIPVEELRLDYVFGVDLKASFVSDFKENEPTIVTNDIRDAADPKRLKDINEGRVVIHTVGDYVDHMVRCYETEPEEVSYILTRPTGLTQQSLWQIIISWFHDK